MAAKSSFINYDNTYYYKVKALKLDSSSCNLKDKTIQWKAYKAYVIDDSVTCLDKGVFNILSNSASKFPGLKSFLFLYIINYE